MAIDSAAAREIAAPSAPSSSAAAAAPPPAVTVDAKVTVTQMTEAGVVWLSGPSGQVCFTLPPESNAAAKNLVIYKGDGSTGVYYTTGLIGAGPSTAAPAASQVSTCKLCALEMARKKVE